MSFMKSFVAAALILSMFALPLTVHAAPSMPAAGNLNLNAPSSALAQSAPVAEPDYSKAAIGVFAVTGVVALTATLWFLATFKVGNPSSIRLPG